jgi:WhiB family redox-sensing transcriptional regulator
MTATGQIARLPGPNFSNYEWQQSGACRHADPALFFHPERERGLARQARDHRAVAVCADCPVLLVCLRHALSAREPYGVWGGTTENQRKKIYARHRRADVIASEAS